MGRSLTVLLALLALGTPAAADTLQVTADSDEGGHLFQSHRGHHSNLMAAR